MKQTQLTALFGGDIKQKPRQERVVTANPVKKHTIVKPVALGTDINSDIELKHVPANISNLAMWQRGTPVPFSFLASFFEKLENESGTLASIEITKQHFLAILVNTPADIIPIGFLCLSQLRPAQEGIELGIGTQGIQGAVATATGSKLTRVRTLVQELGDIGKAAQELKGSQKQLDSFFGKTKKDLTVAGVYKTLIQIANMKGDKSTNARNQLAQNLLVSAKDEEIKFIARILEGKLRIGVAESNFLKAFGRAFREYSYYTQAMEKPSEDDLDFAAKTFKHLYYCRPTIDYILTHFLTKGYDPDGIKITPGVPVKSMLAKPAHSSEELIKRIPNQNRITGEYKYDGERAQIHKSGDKISIFSRGCEDSTEKFQDVASISLTHIIPDSCILDSEVVAYDSEKKHLLPFQEILHRSRTGTAVQTIHVCVFVFDCLYLNGEQLINEPFEKRRELLGTVLREEEGLIQRVQSIDCPISEMKEFFGEAVKFGGEGLMLKDLDSPYEPGHRSSFWGKMKKDYTNEFGTEGISIPDTIDVTVIGAHEGEGKRKGQLGSFLVAIRDVTHDRFQALTRVGSGYSEKTLDEINQKIVRVDPQRPLRNVDYPKGFSGVYVDPTFVMEVAAADLQESKAFPACQHLTQSGKGISARFATFQRFRDDKGPEECTSAIQVHEFFLGQATRVAANDEPEEQNAATDNEESEESIESE